MQVMVGSNVLDAGGDKYDVEKLIPHADYDSEDISNDIALVQLKNNISFSSDVKPIQLPVENTGNDKKLLLSGWGTTTVRYDITVFRTRFLLQKKFITSHLFAKTEFFIAL